MKRNILREKLNDDKPTLSTHIHTTWPSVVEVLGHTRKYDYVEFLYWMKKNLESSDHPQTSLFSTHPVTQERINALMEK